ncbi:ATP-binding protein [Pseudoalteromonas sp. SWYJZ19]|uniref:ATP-binding protein n=1 Tax=Pseudoalteromonas sp. SWYJZ19 TaxID=2792068 RepID=UPI0018CD3D79|nr:ATP-binding protein [Pseudoalteromonas sp. SWYJZ19]MBH0051674.1 putative DNA binding domain-containing protein [Pseudoalteromonas sp. SWYJZ19]
MSSVNYIELLSLDASQDIEILNDCVPDNIGAVISAFLNSVGGFIVVKLSSISESIEEDKDQLEASLQRSISPNAIFSVETNVIQNEQLIIIEVPAGKDIPYSFNNEIYVRESGRAVKASMEVLKDMILSAQIEPLRWERRLSEFDSEEELSVSELNKLLSAKKTPIEVKNNSEDELYKLQLMSLAKHNRLTNAGDILFTKNPARRHPQTRVRAVAYDKKSDDSYNDFKHFEGPLIEVLESVLQFVQVNTPTKIYFSEQDHQRKEKSLFPMKAIKEGLVNALAHRDYSNPSGGVLVEIMKGKVKIWNSGSFPEGIDVDKIQKGHISILRNPDIAHVFYIRNYMEKLGRGSSVIQNECEKYNLLKPEWTSDPDLGVTLTISVPVDYEDSEKESNIENTELIVENILDDLSIIARDNVIELLSVLKGKMSRAEIQQALRWKDTDTLRKYLRIAIKKHCVLRTLPDKPSSRYQKYYLSEKGTKIANSK